jgi:hypothetical protein
MTLKYTLAHQIVIRVLFVSLLLQSCDSGTKTPILTEQAQMPPNHLITSTDVVPSSELENLYSHFTTGVYISNPVKIY